jgi:predicted ribosome quality control (RQC) complex YloA/Tae2 family protein
LAKSPFFNILLTRAVLTTYHTLRCLLVGIRRSVQGRTIAGAFSQEKHRLHLSFEGTTEHLVLDCTPMQSTIYLHPRTARARRNSVALLPALSGRPVRDARLHPSDRIVSIECEGEVTIHAVLFGGRPNVLVADGTGTVIDAFQDARRLIGSPFHLPVADERPIDLDALITALGRGSRDTLRSTLRTHLPTFGPDLLREISARAGTDPSAPLSSLTSHDIDALAGAVTSVSQQLAVPEARVYLEGDGEQPVAFSLIPLLQPAGVKERMFADPHEGVRYFLSRGRIARGTDARRDRIAATLSASCDRSRRTVAALEAELSSSERAGEYERSGNLLMAHAGSIPRGTTSVELEDGGGPLRITLEPHRSAMENARRFFDRAKSARRARREAHERIIVVRAKLERAAALLEELQQLARPDDVEAFLRTHADALPSFGVASSGEPAGPALFRTFLVEGGFEVLAGKNSTNNDLLTLKHARPDDLWFHARGGSGSHVVLRVGSARGEPGKAAREQAAAIAAYFSSMKTSRMAPVAMTRRKYVRKPKGSPPGTVLIEREEVLFVTPALPSGASS